MKSIEILRRESIDMYAKPYIRREVPEDAWNVLLNHMFVVNDANEIF